MSQLVDTNVVSELFRPRPDEGVRRWSRGLTSIHLSVVTIDEIWYGLTRKPNKRVLTQIQSFIEEQCQVLPVTREVAVQAGVMRAELEGRGRVSTQADMMIAATALVNGLTLVTRNSRHFEGCHIPLLDPFRGE